MKTIQGFSFIEMMVVILIIGILATIGLVSFFNIRAKANDTKRKAELSQIGKFFTTSCYLPTAGAGTYDLVDLMNELIAQDVKYQALNVKSWRDPKTGTATHSNYLYIVTAEKDCCLYANLESDSETITLPNISVPTPGGGTGVFASTTPGFNGSKKYFQIAN